MLMTTSVHALPVVNVGGYLFAPYVNVTNEGLFQGFTIDLINALNNQQSKVDFQFVNTSIENRYQAYELGRFDLMLFESKIWGWENFNPEFIPLDIKDGEVYITLRDELKNQDYFNSFAGKSLSLVSGYHYKFAEWNTNTSVLSTHFDIQFVHTNKASIESVVKGRADIAPVTYSYLKHYFLINPKAESKLLISDRFDQQYTHSVLLNPNAIVSAAEIKQWLAGIKDSGQLRRIAEKYNVDL
ncbi:substrate-binding periplasmic protein [Shewanella donghaensis]|uniref:substrate-binding periplasmic protein n=1 Tax=Shewanella donghaensis TaxID=238836 RepID=UPI0013150F5F|nr:transporter substrate-binding domain-containing protein [Shewanella donghaensis]